MAEIPWCFREDEVPKLQHEGLEPNKVQRAEVIMIVEHFEIDESHKRCKLLLIDQGWEGVMVLEHLRKLCHVDSLVLLTHLVEVVYLL